MEFLKTVRKSSVFGCLVGLFGAASLPLVASAETLPTPPSLCVQGKSDCGTVPSVGKKWHPGHYMLTYKGDSQSQLLARCDEIASEKNVRGIMVRKTWGQLESAKNNYTFDQLQQIVARCGSHGKRVWLLLLDRGFNTTSADFVPGYLKTEPQYNGGVAATKNGYIARIWEPAVMDRQIALIQALAARFDNEPYFEGMMPEESAPGFGSATPPASYSTGALAAQLKRLYIAAGSAWPRSNFVAQINFLGNEVPDLVRVAHSSGLAMGGPDTLPPECGATRTSGQKNYTGTEGGTDYRGSMVTMHQIQGPEMGGKEGDCSVAQLSAEGHNYLRNAYYFWLRKTSTPGITWANDILPAIRSGLPYDSTCPKNYSSCKTD
jgi:hypothetical protein